VKKLFSLLVIFTIIMGSNTLPAHAIEVKAYPNKVNVSIHLASSMTMSLNTSYQLFNRETNKTNIIPSNTILTVKMTTNGTNVSYSGFNETSSKGFDVKEIISSKQIAIANTDTAIRRGAASDYDAVKTLKKGEAADYMSSFTNSSNEVWYRVTTGAVTGWVLASTVSLDTSNATPLAKLSNGLTYRGSFYLYPNGTKVQVINYLDMEDYLKGVVPSEMPASWHKEALKAQAIAARSYAANMMSLTDSAASQVYRGYTAEDSRTNTAIKETEGVMVRYNGKPIQTFFHSTSGGRTANVWEVWNSSKEYYPYLASVNDPYEKSPYSNWSQTYSPATILKSFGFSETDKLYDITVTKKGVNGEIGSVTVKTSAGAKTVSGNESVIRKLFPIENSNVYGYLYSNWFTMNTAKTDIGISAQTSSGTVAITDLTGQTVQTASGQMKLSDSNVSIQTSSGVISTEGNGEVSSITLNGKGWGHRIGMSQYGAKGFAENGWTAERILTHYFTGTTVSK
jgi:stage II sporulation protein D